MLRPFFGFYGGKWRDAAKHYPSPKYGTIVEPFAGSAGYSLRYPSLDVRLYDVDPILVGVWDFLIRASESDVLSIPDVPMNGTVDDLPIAQEARWLVGFWLNRAPASPRKRPSAWMRSGIRPGSFWGDRVRSRLASQLKSIRHWRIEKCSYESVENRRATWFVDPPYQSAGKHYRFGSDRIDFGSLSDWCKSRSGQVVVCENEGSDWLPFESIARVKTTRRSRLSHESVWIRDDE